MATLSKTAEVLFVKNPLLVKGDYAIEVDSLGVPTGKTKQGIGKYYNDTPYTLVAFDNNSGVNVGKSSAPLTASNGNLVPLVLTSGAIDGVNTTYTWNKTPVIINFETQMLTLNNGFTGSGLTSIIYTAPMVGQHLSALG
jgi:hypothetical protein